MPNTSSNVPSVIDRVSDYISKSQDADIPTNVVLEAKHHILDSLAASVSGSRLKPGLVAMDYVKQTGGVEEAQVIGSDMLVPAVNAAFANAMMAHADETDDSNQSAFIHPGCGIVPAALAMAEKEGFDGMGFLKGVVAGYDIGCRVTKALGITHHEGAHSSHSIGNNFGAAAASASIARLKQAEIKYVLSYASEQSSGVFYAHRDQEHIEKAFMFAGMPCRNGVTAARLVQAGFTGVADCFTGPDNFFDAFAYKARPELFYEELGKRYEVALTNIKKYSVGSPIQAPLDALTIIMEKHGVKAKEVLAVTARLPSAEVVNDGNMPDINLQYMFAVTLIDGRPTFAAAHSYERMKDPEVLKIKKLVNLVTDKELAESKIPRQGIAEVTTKDGCTYREHVQIVRGAVGNPMTSEEVREKSMDLLVSVLGQVRSEKLIDSIFNLEKVKNVRDLRKLLSVP